MTSRWPRCTPSNVPTVTTVPRTVGGSPDSETSFAAVSDIGCHHMKSAQRRRRFLEVVERHGVTDIERSSANAPKRFQMRSTAGHSAEVARERANVGARAAGDRHVDRISAPIANAPFVDANFDRRKLDGRTLPRRSIGAGSVDGLRGIIRWHLRNHSSEMRNRFVDRRVTGKHSLRESRCQCSHRCRSRRRTESSPRRPWAR